MGTSLSGMLARYQAWTSYFAPTAAGNKHRPLLLTQLSTMPNYLMRIYLSGMSLVLQVPLPRFKVRFCSGIVDVHGKL